MKQTHSFKFVDEKLNRKLIGLLERKARGKFRVGAGGFIYYSSNDEDLIGNQLICEIRSALFKRWQIIMCPKDWAAKYKCYMTEHEIPFNEEIRDDNLRFLVSRSRRPHSWKLDFPGVALAAIGK